MSETLSRRARLGAVALATLAVSAGCGNKDNFAKINGQVITREDYVAALEKAPVQIPGQQQPVRAARYVLDQIVGRKIIMAEASKAGVTPTDDDVKRRYELEKRMSEQTLTDKTFEQALKEQGMTEEQIKDDIRYSLTETALYAKNLKIQDAEIKQTYESVKSQLSIPDRVQLRVIIAAAGSKELQQAKKLLDAKTDFVEVAKQINQGPLRASGGLYPQVLPVSQTPKEWQAQIAKAPEGGVFGPVAAPPGQSGPPIQAWVRVEKKLPGFKLTLEDARPLVIQQIVRQKLQDPANQNVNRELASLKINAKFDASDPKYVGMWNSYKDQLKTAMDSMPGGQQSGQAPVTLPAGGPSGQPGQ